MMGPAALRRTLVVGLLLLPAAGAALRSSTPPTSCKPTAPIDLEAKLVGDPAGPFGITAHARSRTGSPVDLEIVLPDGVDRVAGDRRTRALVADLRLDARAKDRSRREIFVRATVTDGAAVQTRVVPLVLFDGPVPAQGRAAKDSRGEAILDFSP